MSISLRSKLRIQLNFKVCSRKYVRNWLWLKKGSWSLKMGVSLNRCSPLIIIRWRSWRQSMISWSQNLRNLILSCHLHRLMTIDQSLRRCLSITIRSFKDLSKDLLQSLTKIQKSLRICEKKSAFSTFTRDVQRTKLKSLQTSAKRSLSSNPSLMKKTCCCLKWSSKSIVYPQT